MPNPALKRSISKRIPPPAAPRIAALAVWASCLAWLSYGSPGPVELCFILLGLVVPALFIARMEEKRPDSWKDLQTGEVIPFLPLWGWVLLLLPALFLRLYGLTTLSVWPVKDEGIFGYFAIQLCQKWNFSLLQGLNHLPTLFTWIQAGLFKILGPSLFSLWLTPALWSLLFLPVVWAASRQFFSRSLSFLVLAIAALGYWPLFLGRVSTQALFMVVWECLVLGCLGRYLYGDPKRKSQALWALVLAAGGGFYTYLPWAAISLAVGLALLPWDPASGQSKAKEPMFKRFAPAGLYTLVSAILALPLAASLLSQSTYLTHLWAGGENHPWSEHLWLLGAYLRDLFMGARPSSFHYGPLWGGFLNPVSGSLFLLGFLSLFKTKPLNRGIWLLAALALFLLPALFSNDFEDMRIVQLIPLLAVLAALGLQQILAVVPKARRALVLLLVLGLLGGLDAYHLLVVYPRIAGGDPVFFMKHKTPEFARAYTLLDGLNKKDGPGLILLNFNPDPYDQTLYVATYPFNAAENPCLERSGVKWAAVLANAHEQPALKSLFPGGRWVWLSEGLNRADGGFLLQNIPLTPQNRETLEKWTKANQALSGLTYQVMQTGVTPQQDGMLRALDHDYSLFQGDKLLESRYWRIRALHDLAGNNLNAAIKDYQNALVGGLHLAHLYDELGKLEWKAGDVKASEDDFMAALACHPNLTDAAQNLQALETLKKKP
jgi:4-amino-4-deoxy-L-arabinose transferase-like glycosyltransferase